MPYVEGVPAVVTPAFGGFDGIVGTICNIQSSSFGRKGGTLHCFGIDFPRKHIPSSLPVVSYQALCQLQPEEFIVLPPSQFSGDGVVLMEDKRVTNTALQAEVEDIPIKGNR